MYTGRKVTAVRNLIPSQTDPADSSHHTQPRMEDMRRELQVDLACMAWARRQRERQLREALRLSRLQREEDDVQRVLLANGRDGKRLQRTRIIGEEISRPLVLDDGELRRLLSEEDRQRLKHQQVHFRQYSTSVHKYSASLGTS